MSSQEKPELNKPDLKTGKNKSKKIESGNITFFSENAKNNNRTEITKTIIEDISPYMDSNVHIKFKTMIPENAGFNSRLNPKFRDEDYHDSITINPDYQHQDELPFFLLHELGHSFEEKLEQIIKNKDISGLPVGINDEYADFYADLIAIYILKPELLKKLEDIPIAQNTILAIQEMFRKNDFAELRTKLNEIFSQETTADSEKENEKNARLAKLFERVFDKINEYNNLKKPKKLHPEQDDKRVEPKVVEQIKEDLRNLFRNAKNPIAILLQTMETNEFKSVISDELANSIKAQLLTLTFENEYDFVDKVIAVAMPLLKIAKRKKKDAYKQEGREMFTETDIKVTAEIIKESGAQKIYVVGNVGSGKTTFAKELSRAIGYKNIDIDQWFQIFRQEQQREAEGLKELLGYILQKNEPPFIINHADLLRQNLIQDADLIVFLNPKNEELIKTRQLRAESGAEGEWQTVNADDYDKIAEQNLTKLESLGGETKYENKKSGTIARVLKK